MSKILQHLSTLSFFLVGPFLFCSISNSQQPVAQGLHDIVVYMPGVQDRGLPKVILEEIERNQAENGGDLRQVVIPPTIHVHRYYYSGNKEIQGPIVSGGPTMVIAKHPKTMEMVYLDVTLPAGAPKISYSKKEIVYVYPEERVSIKFRGFPMDPEVSVVKYRSGLGMARKLNEAWSNNRQNFREKWQSSPAVEAIRQLNADTRNLALNLKNATGQTAKQIYDSTRAAVELLPGGKPLLNPNPDNLTSRYRSEVQAAGNRTKRLETIYVPTNR